MAKSFDEEMAAALKDAARAQKRVARLKAKKKKEDEKKKKKIGEAITNCFPKLMTLMDDEAFDINEFIKTAEFSRAFHFKYVSPNDAKIPAWTKGEDEKQSESNVVEEHIDPEQYVI